ncbi:MAG: HAD hydrolase family protein [Clostridium paraputrificum]
MSNIKVIIMDVDGTLTNSKKEISKKTKNALIKAQELGAILISFWKTTSGLMDFAKELKMNEKSWSLVCLMDQR